MEKEVVAFQVNLALLRGLGQPHKATSNRKQGRCSLFAKKRRTGIFGYVYMVK